MVHRDIKPANLLLEEGTDVKVADFGAAFLRNSDTTQIMRVGSPLYASPEQLAGQMVTHQSDMFSLGVLLYELLTGSPPWYLPDGTDAADADAFVRERLPARGLSSAAPIRLPDSFEAVVFSSMRQNPDERP